MAVPGGVLICRVHDVGTLGLLEHCSYRFVMGLNER
jgi:hypothetical protein